MKASIRSPRLNALIMAVAYMIAPISLTRPFVNRARSLGFSLEEVAELLDLWRDRNRSTADVKALAKHHMASVERKSRSSMPPAGRSIISFANAAGVTEG